MDVEDLVEALETNQRIVEGLIEAIPAPGWEATLSTRGGRDVGRQFAHLHMNRVRWIEGKSGKDLAADLPRFETKEQPSKRAVVAALRKSNQALVTMFREIAAGTRRCTGQKKGLVTSLAYHVSHESYHRGNIVLTLKQCGHLPDRDVLMGAWDWHRI